MYEYSFKAFFFITVKHYDYDTECLYIYDQQPLLLQQNDNHLHLDLSVPIAPISECSGWDGTLSDTASLTGGRSFSFADLVSCKIIK